MLLKSINICLQYNHLIWNFSGREFDKDGNLANWWGEGSLKKFKEKTTCMAEQYSQYTKAGGHVSKNQNSF